MKFETLNDLKTEFTKGKIKTLHAKITVEDIDYKLLNSTSYSFDGVINNETKPMVVFSIDRKKENVASYNEKHTDADDANSIQSRIVFIWAVNRLIVRPVDVKFVSRGRMDTIMVKEEVDRNVIGDVVDVRFTSMPQSVTIKGKVDTGALMSSLHADKININDKNNTVSFLSKILSPNIITLPLQDKQAIKSADGGTEYRPVIAVNININGKPLKDVLLNLNDRSNMDHKLLVGQNILEKGKFLIDPSIQENEGVIDWDKLQGEFNDIEITEEISEFSDEHLIEELRIRIKNKK